MRSWRTWLLTLCAVLCVFSVSDAMGPSRGGRWHVGGLTQEQLYREYPEFAKAAERYAPKEEVVREIRGVDQKGRSWSSSGPGAPTREPRSPSS